MAKRLNLMIVLAAGMMAATAEAGGRLVIRPYATARAPRHYGPANSVASAGLWDLLGWSRLLNVRLESPQTSSRDTTLTAKNPVTPNATLTRLESQTAGIQQILKIAPTAQPLPGEIPPPSGLPDVQPGN